MAAFPTEIITEILSRLPVKSLARFKCVCKFWNFLMKTPNFIKLHLNQTLISNSDRHILFCDPSLYSAELDNNYFSFSEIQIPLSTQGIEVFGSCNGIISICNKTEILLFNPLTKSHFKLPFTSKSQAFPFGFGYDSKTDDYKVLKLVQWRTSEIKHRLSENTNEVGTYPHYVEAELYSLNNNSWKSVQGIYASIVYDTCEYGVLVNEALHYLVSSNKSHRITSFDLHTESFSFMDCPKLIDCSGAYAQLTELGRCLCAFVDYHDMSIIEDDMYIMKGDIWAMKEYGNNESWVKLYSIGNECPQLYTIKPIVYSKDGKKILLDIGYVSFGWYDLESKTFDALESHRFSRGSLATMCFLGSLVSIEDKLHSERETLPMITKQ